MNNSRRKQLEAILSSLEDVKCDEQEYLDNMPENLFESERAENAQNAIDRLEEAISNIEEIIYV